MKKPRLLLSVSIALFLAGAWLFWSGRGTAVDSRATELLHEAFAKANEVEVRVLGSIKQHPELPLYLTKIVGDEYAVVGTHLLIGDQAKELCHLFGEHLFDSHGGSACHHPGYALQFRKDGQMIVSFSLCLHCTNIELEPYPWSPVWMGVYDRQNLKLRLDRLETFLSKAESSPSR